MKILPLSATAIAVALTLTACGGSSSSTVSPPSRMADPQPVELAFASLTGGRTVTPGIYRLAGDKDLEGFYAALGTSSDVPTDGIDVAELLNLKCSGTTACRISIDEKTQILTIVGTIEFAAFEEQEMDGTTAGGGTTTGGGGTSTGGGDEGTSTGNGNGGTTVSTHALLGPMDLAALATVIDGGDDGNGGVAKPALGDTDPCGANADCKRLVGELEKQAKDYNLPSTEELGAKSIGEGTFADLTAGPPKKWVMQLSAYRTALQDAIEVLEEGDPPYTPTEEAIQDAVDAAALSQGSFSGATNKIASDFDASDFWGVWIKEDDASALNYWHDEGGNAVGVQFHDRGNLFGGYDNVNGSGATYRSNLRGYAHYTDMGNSDALETGKFKASVELDANFDAEGVSTASITGTVDAFQVNTAQDPGWGRASLKADYSIGGTGFSGYWQPDFVYDETGTVGTDRQPGGIRGRIGLTFTGTNPGAAAGVFDVTKQ